MTRTLTQRIVAIEKIDLFIGIDLGLDNNVAVVIDHFSRRVQLTLKFIEGRRHLPIVELKRVA